MRLRHVSGGLNGHTRVFVFCFLFVRAQEEFGLAQKACQDLSEDLRRITTEKQTCDLKTSAEIDDLYRTKRNLEERLIELIR